MRLAVVFFFSNRKLLIERAAPVSVFSCSMLWSLAQSSTVRWLIGALLPTCHNLRLVRVQCATLLVWVLRLHGHLGRTSHSTVCGYPAHCQALGTLLVGFLWDVLLLQHWKLVGHMLRSTSCASCLSRAFAAPHEVHGDAVRRCLRRHRAGPYPGGFSCASFTVAKWLASRHCVGSTDVRPLAGCLVVFIWCAAANSWTQFVSGSWITYGMVCKMLARSLLRQPKGFCSTWSVCVPGGSYVGWEGIHSPCSEKCSFDEIIGLLLAQILVSFIVHLRLILYVETSLVPFDIPNSSAKLWDRWIAC